MGNGDSTKTLTCVNCLLDGDEAYRQRVLDIDELHINQDIAQVALQREEKQRAVTTLCIQAQPPPFQWDVDLPGKLSGLPDHMYWRQGKQRPYNQLATGHRTVHALSNYSSFLHVRHLLSL